MHFLSHGLIIQTRIGCLAEEVQMEIQVSVRPKLSKVMKSYQGKTVKEKKTYLGYKSSFHKDVNHWLSEPFTFVLPCN